MKKGVIALVVAVVAVGGVVAVVMMNKKDDKGKTSSMNSSDMSKMDGTSADTSEAVATDKVDIKDFAYSPANITVKKGTTVTWTNSDSAPHTVDGDDNKSIESETLNEGDTFTFTFDTVGTFKYHCDFHSNMHGSVTVTE